MEPGYYWIRLGDAVPTIAMFDGLWHQIASETPADSNALVRLGYRFWRVRVERPNT